MQPITSTTLTVGSDVRPTKVTFDFGPASGSPFTLNTTTNNSASSVTYDDDEEAMAGKAAKAKPYGDVKYADPGYRDGTKRYPIDTPEHVRAAWAYINMPKNAAKYNEEQLKEIKARIEAAAKHHGVEITESSSGEASVVLAGEDPAALLAGAAPLQPPASWFTNPGLAAPTKMTITEDGRVFGHLALWRVCHVGIGNSCVMAPKTHMDYGVFKIGNVVADNGAHIPVGKLVMGSAHANAQWGVMPARDFYDNTSMTAAVVTVGEDRFGIWYSGALTTNMTPEKTAELRASAVSGDWRTVNGNLELIAALAVNSPGFPIYRESGGRAFSLQAVGVLENDEGEFMTEPEVEETTLVAGAAPEIDEEKQARLERLRAIDGDVAPPTGIQAGAAPVDEKKSPADRLKAIDADQEKKQRSKRMDRLSAIDGDRAQFSDYRPVQNSPDTSLGIYQMVGVPNRLRRLPDEQAEDVDFSQDAEEADANA